MVQGRTWYDEDVFWKLVRGTADDLGFAGAIDQVDPLRSELEETLWQLLAGRTAALARHLSRSRARRIALIGGGVAIGLVAGGLAAPVVGGALGGSMGLSGVAATNAGLAALGGGSLASGGFGIAGGTMLIQAMAAASGAGVAVGGGALAGRLGDVSADALAAELAQTVVVVEHVVLGSMNDVRLAKQICDSLEEALRDHEAALESLGEAGKKAKGGVGRKCELLDRAVIEILVMIEMHQS
jgi:hypothetical protein